jgi:hypothetical protein
VRQFQAARGEFPYAPDPSMARILQEGHT